MKKYTILLLTFPFLLLASISKENFVPGEPIEKGIEAGDINLPARYEVDHSYNLYFGGSFLYWYTQQAGLEVGRQRIIQASQSKISDNLDVDFDYEPGFNVFVGKKLCWDHWNVYLDYTRLHFTVSQTYNSPDNTYYVPYWLSAVIYPTTTITTMHGSWRLKYDMFDFMITRPFYVGRRLIITPEMGLRGGVINQRYRATYGNQGGVSAKQNSWLVGPRAMADMNWLIAYGFSFDAYVGGGLYYQHFDISDQQMVPTNIYPLQLDKETQNVTPHFQIGGGLGYNQYFANDRWHVSLDLLYNFEVYLHQNEMRKLSDTSHTDTDRQTSDVGDLIFHGLVVALRFDF